MGKGVLLPPSLSFTGHAAGSNLQNYNYVAPALIKATFPGSFDGFASAAIAIGALVPA
jgi:Na+/proline symporter